jgi:imidazolonepropionase-like amidohydrolase
MRVLRAERMFDGRAWYRGPVQVAVEEGRIADVGPPAPVAEGVEVLDLGEATLLPGLVDAHVHLTWDATREAVAPRHDATPDELLAQADRAALAAPRGRRDDGS